MSGRKTTTFRVEPKVDQWLDDFTDDESFNRSDVMNRAIKVYAAKLSRGEWRDPKFVDKHDKEIEKL